MTDWKVMQDYVKGEKVFVVYRDNLRTGKREQIGSFDRYDHAVEFADALNSREAAG